MIWSQHDPTFSEQENPSNLAGKSFVHLELCVAELRLEFIHWLSFVSNITSLIFEIMLANLGNSGLVESMYIYINISGITTYYYVSPQITDPLKSRL